MSLLVVEKIAFAVVGAFPTRIGLEGFADVEQEVDFVVDDKVEG